MQETSPPPIPGQSTAADRVAPRSRRVRISVNESTAPAAPAAPRPSGTPSPHRGQPDAAAAPLDELRTALARFVVLPSEQALDATVLWIAATHLQQVWQHAPRLAVVGPAKRCGKSRLLDLLTETVHKPVITVNSTAAAIFRSISDEPPTLLVDEADTIFGSPKVAEKNEEMRGLLNAGHQRGRPVLRVVGKEHTPHSFATFAMAALAGIGDLPDTIMDRSVVIRMRRRAEGEQVSPYRTRRDSPALRSLRAHLARWTASVAEQALHLEPKMPVEDRAADTWEPLVIVADLAGGTWPEHARTACEQMVTAEAQAEEDNPSNARILADIRRAFAAAGDPESVSTDALLYRLNSEPEAPWAEAGRGGLSPRALAGLLREYGIRSGNVRMPDGNQLKGYTRTKFTDAWKRYCPTVHPEIGSDGSRDTPTK
ncbi:DUF3631 domain-containing protein [Streptomyces sp. NPDC059698]|uniref:DUF3631 domain-containing protein n=1 Tax=unclassified Streptomyces TaxID=2593676 RepID=UPI0009A0F754